MKKLATCILAVALLQLLVVGMASAGSVKGTVKYDGKVPNLKPIKMDADPGCAKKHSTPPASEMLLLGDGNTMGNIFVQVTKGLPNKSHTAPGDAVVIDQEGCRYSPHVAGLMVGQSLKILNSDGLLHNVHALPKVNQGFNQAMPGSVKETVKTFSKPEPMFKIKCDVHPWMGAYVAVLDHPYFDVTETDGAFQINGLPAGTYTIQAWHERLGTQEASVTISGDGAQTADFTFAPPSR